MDGLSVHIKWVVAQGNFRALVLGLTSKYHSFFVDDVLIMGMISRFAWLTLYHIFFNLETPWEFL